MSKKNQYPVQKFYGLPVENNGSGGYQFKVGATGKIKIHTWRTGKHTKGQYHHPGQLLLTENNLMVMIVDAEPMAFKDRHREVPCQRFLSVEATSELLKAGRKILQQQSDR
ncbi:hypothetical protein [uncultured Limosilactobacillus sp.]|uniref:DUF7671 family protein n=1 Tax=uncultured Limosilactobacillus sp. TaxID=2837629 RepID=UPI0025DE7CFF|nr:hypothetical protein [uncultured Limosilactobacillus sp.]